MNKNFRILVLSLLAGFAANAKLDAESYQWTGPASGNWNDANNWTPSQVPGTGDTASISGNVAVDIASTVSINGLSVANGSSLTVSTGGVLNILDGAVVFGPLVNAGTVNWLGGEIMIFYSPSNGWSGT
ncbi:MAG: hypothetical protein NTV46_00985, partial [Verrucomicrobia bacterium]|nr:hypothetical protein [Verrucomicrobiota bacterium]